MEAQQCAEWTGTNRPSDLNTTTLPTIKRGRGSRPCAVPDQQPGTTPHTTPNALTGRPGRCPEGTSVHWSTTEWKPQGSEQTHHHPGHGVERWKNVRWF